MEMMMTRFSPARLLTCRGKKKMENVWEQSSKAAADDSYHWRLCEVKDALKRSHTPLDHQLQCLA